MGFGRQIIVLTGLFHLLAFRLDAGLAEQYLILDPAGREVAPRDTNGAAPFGLLISPVDDGVSTCSSAHISEGVVIANRHCINGTTPNEKIIYFDRQGQKQVAQVTHYRFPGNQEGIDMAVMEIDEVSAKNWDVIPGDGKRTSFKTRRDFSRPLTVKVWSFDPLKTHPNLAARFGRKGVVFNPKTCTASATTPSVRVVASGRPVEIRDPSWASPAHLFLDNCDSELRKGNSGSIITMADDVSKKVGTIHWVFPRESLWKTLSENGLLGSNAQYQYSGNSRRWEDIPFVQEGNVFAVGSFFESMLRLNTRLFEPGGSGYDTFSHPVDGSSSGGPASRRSSLD